MVLAKFACFHSQFHEIKKMREHHVRPPSLNSKTVFEGRFRPPNYNSKRRRLVVRLAFPAGRWRPRNKNSATATEDDLRMLSRGVKDLSAEERSRNRLAAAKETRKEARKKSAKRRELSSKEKLCKERHNEPPRPKGQPGIGSLTAALAWSRRNPQRRSEGSRAVAVGSQDRIETMK